MMCQKAPVAQLQTPIPLRIETCGDFAFFVDTGLLNGFLFSFFSINLLVWFVHAVDQTDFLSVFDCTLNICIHILIHLKLES